MIPGCRLQVTSYRLQDELEIGNWKLKISGHWSLVTGDISNK